VQWYSWSPCSVGIEQVLLSLLLLQWNRRLCRVSHMLRQTRAPLLLSQGVSIAGILFLSCKSKRERDCVYTVSSNDLEMKGGF